MATAPSASAASSEPERSTATPPRTPRMNKGKGRADDLVPSPTPAPAPARVTRHDQPLAAALNEALNDDISPPTSDHRRSLSSSNYADPPISPPPRAHHPMAATGLGRPKLVSHLTRTTLPQASMSYASGSQSRTHSRRSSGIVDLDVGDEARRRSGEGSSRRRQPSLSAGFNLDDFPELDPTTGLPLGGSGGGGSAGAADSDGRSLHLQRTITDLLTLPTLSSSSDKQQHSAEASSSTTSSQLSRYLPNMPSMPNMPTLPGMSSLPSLNSLPRMGSLLGSSAGSRSSSTRPSLDLKRTGSRRSVSSSSSAKQQRQPDDGGEGESDWSMWPSWWNGNKNKVDKQLSEDDQADTVEEEKENMRKKYRSPKNPVVFCHGLLGFDYIGPANLPPLQIAHWRGIREVLESNGTEVMIARVPATASIQDRAAILAEKIGEQFPGREVNLVGHSMGGLDCRYLISEIQDKSFKPISLTTISTPHRGSPFADYVIDNLIGRERLPALLSLMESLRLPQSGDGSAFNALGTKSMKEFNTIVVDDPEVKYYSWGASVDPGLLDTFRWPHSVILSKEGPNDGLVSVHSARWGEYRGTLVGVNHLDLVGWVNTFRNTLAGWTGAPVPFKPATFYMEVADYLAEQGF